jgi:putative Ca2+/H+ antiporter (TMEM165/GDT1 family)
VRERALGGNLFRVARVRCVDAMDTKLFATVFATVFLAELGDKTQVATLLFAADERNSRLTVFAASAAALLASSALGVVAGTLARAWLQPRLLTGVAGVLFLALGAWSLWRTFRA